MFQPLPVDEFEKVKTDIADWARTHPAVQLVMTNLRRDGLGHRLHGGAAALSVPDHVQRELAAIGEHSLLTSSVETGFSLLLLSSHHSPGLASHASNASFVGFSEPQDDALFLEKLLYLSPPRSLLLTPPPSSWCTPQRQSWRPTW